MSIQSIKNKIAAMSAKVGLYSISKGEFFGTLNDVADELKKVNDNVNSVAKSLIWQAPVADVAALPTTYPTPQPGDAAMVTGEGLVYSWNGVAWKSTGLTSFPVDVALNGGSDKTINDLDSTLPIFESNGSFSFGNAEQYTSTMVMQGENIQIPVPNRITITLAPGFQAFVWGYDSNGNEIVYNSGFWDSGHIFEVSTPYIRCVLRRYNGSEFLASDVSVANFHATLEKTKGLDLVASKIDVENINQTVEQRTIISKFVNNVFLELPISYGYIDLGGGVQGDGVDENWVHTGFLQLKKGDSIEYNLSIPTNVLGVSFYDKNKIKLSSSIPGNSNTDLNGNFVNNSDDIKYVRFCTQNNQLSTHYASGNLYSNDISSELSSVIENSKRVDAELKVLNTTVLKNKNRGFKYDINHFVDYGQSLSQGDWSTTIISNIQKYNSLMFTGGMRVWENRNQSSIYDALVPAVENAFQYQNGETVVGANWRGETPCVGIAEKITQLIQTEDNFDISKYQYQLLLSAPGMGGESIENLMYIPGPYYQRLLRDITNGKRLANAQGKNYACLGVSWIQGETNCDLGTTEQHYYDMMKLLFDNLNVDIKAITGQIEDVHFFLYQTWCYDFYYTGFHYPDVPLAQLRLSLEMDNVHMSCPIYNLPLIDDYVHLTPVGSKILGGSIGLAYKRTIVDGVNWNPIHLIDYWLDGNNVYLKFYAPTLPLKFDITTVPDMGISKGFQFRNIADRTQNSFLNIITSVTVNKPDVIKITCNADPRGKKLTYLINGTATPSNKLGLCSGNLRDSQEIEFNFKDDINASEETTHYLYNFCPLFEKIIE
jgi:hypothetical protein